MLLTSLQSEEKKQSIALELLLATAATPPKRMNPARDPEIYHSAAIVREFRQRMKCKPNPWQEFYSWLIVLLLNVNLHLPMQSSSHSLRFASTPLCLFASTVLSR